MLKYPNLELLEFKANHSLFTQSDFIEIYKKAKDSKPYMRMSFVADVFVQTWGSGALGFDNSNELSPQTLTDAYTVVFHELLTDIYIIFFGDAEAYMVTNANEIFINDLHDHAIKSINEAKEYY